MKILIKAKHFNKSNYYSSSDCALARALTELGYSDVQVLGYNCSFNDNTYDILEEQVENESVIQDNYDLEEPLDITVTLIKQ